jgi:hypothetical protein
VYPNWFDQGLQCLGGSWATLVSVVEGIPDADCVTYIDAVADENGINVSSLDLDADHRGSLVLMSHGATDGSLIGLSFHNTPASANTQLQYLIDRASEATFSDYGDAFVALAVDAWGVPGCSAPTRWAVALKTSKMNAVFETASGEGLDDGALVIAMHCGASGIASKWKYGTYVAPIVPGADMRDMIPDLATLLSNLTCEGGTCEECNPDVANARQGVPGVNAWGHGANQLIPCWMSCKKMGSVLGAKACGDTVSWVCMEEPDSAVFTIRRLDSDGAGWDTLAVIPGAGEPADGGARVYCFGGVGWGESGDVAMSTAVGGAETVEHARFGPVGGDCSWVCGDTFEAADVGAPPAAAADSMWVLSGDSIRRVRAFDREQSNWPDDYCADVMVCSTSNMMFWFTLTFEHVATILADDGVPLKPVGFSSMDGSPMAVRANFEQVRAANLAYNASHGGHDFRPNPIVMLGGTQFSPLEDPCCDEICGVNGCASFARITDIDGDGMGEGPVTVVPAETWEELALALQYAEEYNAGTYVDPEGGVAILVGDRIDEDAGPWLAETMGNIHAVYATSGQPVRCTLVESEFGYLDLEEMCAAMEECVAGGVADIWIEGFQTNWVRLTEFFKQSCLAETRSRCGVFAPSCLTGAYYVDEGSAGLRKALFGNPLGTTAAFFVGTMAEGFEPEHACAREALLNELTCASTGDLMVDVVQRAMNGVEGEFPGFGTSLQVFGGLARYRGHLSWTGQAPAGPAVRSEALKCWVRMTTTGLQWDIECYELGQLLVELFDASGRRVGRLWEGRVAVGVAKGTASVAETASGVYFVRSVLSSSDGEDVVARKVVVVK